MCICTLHNSLTQPIKKATTMHASSLITSFYKTGLLRRLKYLITQSPLYNNARRLPGLLEPYNLFYNFNTSYKIAFIAILLCLGT